MAYEFKLRKTVEFAETDMAGIMHFANFFRYMEVVEHTFFRSLGLKLHSHSEEGVTGFARAETGCTFRQPLRYEDVVELHLLVKEKRSKTITYQIVFRKVEGDELTEVARGTLTVVCVSRPHGGTYKSAAISAEVNAQIEAAPAELLS